MHKYAIKNKNSLDGVCCAVFSTSIGFIIVVLLYIRFSIFLSHFHFVLLKTKKNTNAFSYCYVFSILVHFNFVQNIHAYQFAKQQ